MVEGKLGQVELEQVGQRELGMGELEHMVVAKRMRMAIRMELGRMVVECRMVDRIRESGRKEWKHMAVKDKIFNAICSN